MLDIISDNVMIVLVMCMVTIILTCLPLTLNHLKDERKDRQAERDKQREVEQAEHDKQREADARRNREEDISVVLGNVLKVDTVMDYVTSRGSNKEVSSESNYDKVVELVKATSNKE